MIKKIKKTAIAISLMIFAGSTSLNVSAEENVPIVYINAGYGSENDITEVELNIKNNQGISSYSIEVDYNPSVLQFIDASQGDTPGGGTFYCNDKYDEDAIRIVWSNSRNKNGDGTTAILRFKAAYGTAETTTPLSIGYSVLGDDLNVSSFESVGAELKIAGEITRGDVSGDGDVNIADIVRLNMFLLNSEKNPLSNTSQANAEVTGDKIVTTADSTLLMNYVCMMLKEL